MDSAYSGHLITSLQWLQQPMALIPGGTFAIKFDLSGHYNRLALISVDIISGVYCIT